MTQVQIDHFMWGAPDLDEGITQAERLFATRAAPGGSHPGLGTRNALLSLGESVYLEIIAPDPEQNLKGTFGERLGELETCELITWAAASSQLAAVSAELAEQQIPSRGPVHTERQTPQGDLLEWDLLFPDAGDYAGVFPFFIDWLGCPHPATQNPPAGWFQSLQLTSPNAPALVAMLASLGLDEVDVQSGAPGITLEIAVGGSTVVLSSTPQSMALRLG